MAETEARQDDERPDTVVRAHRWYRESRDHSSEWRNVAREWYDMASGEQWEATDLMRLQDQQRPAVVFNRILRTINAVTGTQISNRQETTFRPRELGDVKTNEILNGAAEWVRDGCDADDEESDAFVDLGICGMGWTETLLSYDNDPEGKILIDRTDPLEMYWDPAARKRNLSDARWFMHVRSVDLEEFQNRWPEADPELSQSPWEGEDDDSSKRVHVYPQDAYKNEQANRKAGKRVARIRVAHLQWAERKTAYRVGKRAERMEAGAFDKLRDKLDQHKIGYMKQQGVSWKRAFIAGGEILEEGESPYPDGSTFRCMTYERDRNKGTWFGLVKAMVDPQRFGNKFFSQILDILNKGAKGGIMAEADAVEDFRELEAKWARPDSVIKMKSGAISQGKVQEKPLVKLPVGLEPLMAFSLDAVHEVNGISLEFLGSADRNQPGVLEHQRKQAGLTILAPLFNSMRRYRKEQGRVLLYFIQTYISDGRLIRILGQNGREEYVPLSKQPETARYDVIVDEAPTSPNMKDRVYAALTEMLPSLAKMGLPLPPELLDYAPIPSALAEKWKEKIEQGQQIPPEIQKQMQKLVEENRKLKDKREETAAKLQIDQASAQAKGQLDQQAAMAKAGMDQEALRLKMEEAEMEHRLKLEEMQRTAEIKRAEVELDARLAQEKAQAEMELEQWKTQQQLELQRQKTEGELAIKMAQASAGEDGTVNLERVRRLLRDDKPRRFTVNRGADGLMQSIDIEDVLADVQGSA